MKKEKYIYNSVGWWLNKLPMSARMKARKGSHVKLKTKIKAGTLAGVLNSIFVWSATKEGLDYWMLIEKKYGNQR